MPDDAIQRRALVTPEQGHVTVHLRRTQHARRLYRLTGGGLYRDTVLVGGTPPVAEPLLSSAGVLGQDSLMAAPFNGKIFWFFGDTECPAGPRDTDCQHYGRFTTGATSAISPSGGGAGGGNGTAPPSLSYFTSTNASAPGGMNPSGTPSAASILKWNPRGFGHPKAMLAGPGIPPLYNMSTWVGSLTVLTDTVAPLAAAPPIGHSRSSSNSSSTANTSAPAMPTAAAAAAAPTTPTTRMYLTYVCPNGGPDKLYGIALWDEDDKVFKPVPGQGYKMRYSGAQAVQITAPGGDEGYVYYASAFAMSRVKATFAAIEDPSQYEYFTPCMPVEAGGCKVQMTAASWGWKKSGLASDGASGVAYFGPAQELAAVRGGYLPAHAARMQVLDAATQRPVGGTLSRGSVNWNAFRGKYVLIADRMDTADGSNRQSRFGEIYYCESRLITGPWRECHTVATHAVTGTSCYNPLQLPWLDEDGGKVVHFACTFTSMTSSGPGPTDRACRFDDYGGVDCAVAVPRYEYNNLVFQLDVEQMVAAAAGMDVVQ